MTSGAEQTNHPAPATRPNHVKQLFNGSEQLGQQNNADEAEHGGRQKIFISGLNLASIGKDQHFLPGEKQSTETSLESEQSDSLHTTTETSFLFKEEEQR